MKMLRVPLLLVGLLLASQGWAANTQQEKMKSCNATATTQGLKGAERKTYVSSCLKAKPATQQMKMKTCNTEASGKALKGDERKAFMSTCLKKS